MDKVLVSKEVVDYFDKNGLKDALGIQFKPFVDNSTAGYDKSTVLGYDVVISDPMAGLSADDRKQYEALTDEKAKANFKQSKLKERYSSSFLGNYGDNDPEHKAIYDDIILENRVTDQGYMSSLDENDRNKLVMDYAAYCASHSKYASFGVTDDEMDERMKNDPNAVVNNQNDMTSCIGLWRQANASDYDIALEDSKHSSLTANADSFFQNIKSNVSKVVTAAKAFITEKAIPYIKSAWNKIFGHEDKQTAKEDDKVKTNEKDEYKSGEDQKSDVSKSGKNDRSAMEENISKLAKNRNMPEGYESDEASDSQVTGKQYEGAECENS